MSKNAILVRWHSYPTQQLSLRPHQHSRRQPRTKAKQCVAEFTGDDIWDSKNNNAATCAALLIYRQIPLSRDSFTRQWNLQPTSAFSCTACFGLASILDISRYFISKIDWLLLIGFVIHTQLSFSQLTCAGSRHNVRPASGQHAASKQMGLEALNTRSNFMLKEMRWYYAAIPRATGIRNLYIYAHSRYTGFTAKTPMLFQKLPLYATPHLCCRHVDDGWFDDDDNIDDGIGCNSITPI